MTVFEAMLWRVTLPAAPVGTKPLMTFSPSTLTVWTSGSVLTCASPTPIVTVYVPFGTEISHEPGRGVPLKVGTLLPCMCMSVSRRWSGCGVARSRPLPGIVPPTDRSRGVVVPGVTQP